MRINNVSFGANMVNRVQILKKDEIGGYKPYDAKFVEFNINESQDIEKIWEICKMPEFALYGYELPESLIDDNKINIKKHCFALIKDSENDYSQINKENVLGIFTYNEIQDGDVDRIPLFMTNLKFRTRWYRQGNEKEFTHIGEGMVNALKKMFPKKIWHAIQSPVP